MIRFPVLANFFSQISHFKPYTAAEVLPTIRAKIYKMHQTMTVTLYCTIEPKGWMKFMIRQLIGGIAS
jgi:hypothetical protein